MKETFCRARYILALATNSLTADVRQAFMESADIDTSEKAQSILAKAVHAISKNDDISADDEKAMISTEFNALGMKSFFGDYDLCKGFFEGLVDIRRTAYSYEEWLPMLKLVWQLSESLSDELKICVYIVILDNLVKRSLVAQDTEFAAGILGYLDAADTDAFEHNGFVDMVASVISTR